MGIIGPERDSHPADRFQNHRDPPKSPISKSGCRLENIVCANKRIWDWSLQPLPLWKPRRTLGGWDKDKMFSPECHYAGMIQWPVAVPPEIPSKRNKLTGSTCGHDKQQQNLYIPVPVIHIEKINFFYIYLHYYLIYMSSNI